MSTWKIGDTVTIPTTVPFVDPGYTWYPANPNLTGNNGWGDAILGGQSDLISIWNQPLQIVRPTVESIKLLIAQSSTLHGKKEDEYAIVSVKISEDPLTASMWWATVELAEESVVFTGLGYVVIGESHSGYGPEGPSVFKPRIKDDMNISFGEEAMDNFYFEERG